MIRWCFRTLFSCNIVGYTIFGHLCFPTCSCTLVRAPVLSILCWLADCASCLYVCRSGHSYCKLLYKSGLSVTATIYLVLLCLLWNQKKRKVLTTKYGIVHRFCLVVWFVSCLYESLACLIKCNMGCSWASSDYTS